MSEARALVETGDVTFTFDWYGQFLDALVARDRRFRGYDDTLDSGDVLLRHDVDWSPRNALETARIEAQRGVRATYFFLLSSPFYNLFHRRNRRVLAEIHSLGHDVGLHFSTHQYWERRPPAYRLGERVTMEREALSAVVDPIETISFHQPPEWTLARTFDAFPSTYEPRFFEEIDYRADSRQRWRDEHPLADGLPDRVQVLTHPGLWGETDADFEERLAAHADDELDRVRRFIENQYVTKSESVPAFVDREF